MIARSESWFLRADPVRVAGAAAAGIAVFAVGWVLLHTGPFASSRIVDTPTYESYGDAMTDGQVPYRDFSLEYPPGALPVFVLPALGSDEDYDGLFEALMLVCGAALVGFVAAGLAARRVAPVWLAAGVGLAALLPLLLGPLLLSRFDLWPAALTAGALAALLAGRPRLGLGVLGVAVAAKIYPLVLLPVVALYLWRRRGRRETLVALAVFAAVVVLIVGPFAVLAPHGLWESVTRQTDRPLQLESLGSSALLVGHRMHLYDPTIVTTYGSQNLAGDLPDRLATIQTVLQALALLAVWIVFARSSRTVDQLVAACAASVAAFVAFGKVLSPQFLVWLVPVVALAAGRRWALAGGLCALALVVTQLWFPYRYWNVTSLEPVVWLVLLRDLLLVALFGALLALTRREPEPRGSP
jgi:Glycosyltransferase family 87